MLKYNRIARSLLSIFLLLFFNIVYSQIYISEGATIYVENNTVVSQNLKRAVSKSLSVSESSEKQRSRSDRKKAHKKSSALVLLKSTQEKDKSRRKNQELEIYIKKNKLVSLYHHCNNKDNPNFKVSDFTKKNYVTTRSTSGNGKLLYSFFFLASAYYCKKESSYYKSRFLQSLNNKSLRIRSPPSI